VGVAAVAVATLIPSAGLVVPASLSSAGRMLRQSKNWYEGVTNETTRTRNEGRALSAHHSRCGGAPRGGDGGHCCGDDAIKVKKELGMRDVIMEDLIMNKEHTVYCYSRDLYNEVAANHELLQRFDEKGVSDTTEDLAALRSVIRQIKVATASALLLKGEKVKEGTVYHTLSKSLRDIYCLKTIADMDSLEMLPDVYKPILKTISPQTYLAKIKNYTEQVYTALST
jgi:hypothetical protein